MNKNYVKHCKNNNNKISNQIFVIVIYWLHEKIRKK
jgi:hypothetical protein